MNIMVNSDYIITGVIDWEHGGPGPSYTDKFSFLSQQEDPLKLIRLSNLVYSDKSHIQMMESMIKEKKNQLYSELIE
jgi:hypothetical protein